MIITERWCFLLLSVIIYKGYSSKVLFCYNSLHFPPLVGVSVSLLFSVVSGSYLCGVSVVSGSCVVVVWWSCVVVVWSQGLVLWCGLSVLFSGFSLISVMSVLFSLIIITFIFICYSLGLQFCLCYSQCSQGLMVWWSQGLMVWWSSYVVVGVTDSGSQ